MLAHCQHKDMAGSYIARHDEAMRKIIKAALKGQQGSNYVIADVGRLPELQKLGVHSKRIRACTLPDEFVDTSGSEQHNRGSAPYAPGCRDKMRPDIMPIEMTPFEYQQHNLHPSTKRLSLNLPTGSARKVWIVEGGYVDKFHEKQQQHKRLEASLKAYGYDVHVLPVTLGFYGTIPNSAVEAMHTLGIERKRAKKLLLAHTRHHNTTRNGDAQEKT